MRVMMSRPSSRRRAGSCPGRHVRLAAILVCTMGLAACGEPVPVDTHNRAPADADSHVIEHEPLQAPNAAGTSSYDARQDDAAAADQANETEHERR